MKPQNRHKAKLHNMESYKFGNAYVNIHLCYYLKQFPVQLDLSWNCMKICYF